MNLVEKLQNKPKYIRVQVLWVAVILFMIIVLFFWLSNMERNLAASKKQENNDQKSSTPSVFNIIKKDISDFSKNLKSQTSQIFNSKNNNSQFEVEVLE